MLPIDKLKGAKPTEKIDLFGTLITTLGIASVIIIGGCIKGNCVLKKLKCAAAP